MLLFALAMNNEYPDSPNTYSVIILQKVKIEIYTKIYLNAKETQLFQK